jgi:hypothetical protein
MLALIRRQAAAFDPDSEVASVGLLIQQDLWRKERIDLLLAHERAGASRDQLIAIAARNDIDLSGSVSVSEAVLSAVSPFAAKIAKALREEAEPDEED